jgi:hypothetical protein
MSTRTHSATGRHLGQDGLSGKKWSGNELQDRELDGADFTEAEFEDLNLRGQKLRRSQFCNVRVGAVDFRGADLTGAENLHTVKRIERMRFNDDTILDEIDLRKIEDCNAPTARLLRQHRYAGKLKRQRPCLYWPWQITSGCGRSWFRLVGCVLAVILFFGACYYTGTQKGWRGFPKLVYSVDSDASGHNFVTAIQFSAMTFAGSDMPQITWRDCCTSWWTLAECWIGLALLGVFITIVAVGVVPRE